MYITLMTSLFIGTNIDFFILLIPLMKKYGFRDTTIGYLSAVLIMYILSATIGQAIQNLFPVWVIGILGLVPIWFGIRGGEEEAKDRTLKFSILTVSVVYLTSCSADNLALYVPVLSLLKNYQIIIYGIYFVILVFFTSVLAYYTSNIKVIKILFNKFGELITRIIYICMGLFVIFDTGLVDKILSILF